MSELNRMKLKQHGSAVMMYDEYPANAAWLNMLQMLSGCAAVQIPRRHLCFMVNVVAFGTHAPRIH